MSLTTRSSLILFMLFVTSSALPGSRVSSDKQARQFAATVGAICRADYRGDREQLRQLAETLARSPQPGRAAFREYWIGFAYWRRAINGFNENPTPSDLLPDLERCATRQRAALEIDPQFEEARSALLGCLMNKAYFAKQLPPAEMAELVKEVQSIGPAVKAAAEHNPRSLWLLGGAQLFAPPPHGGDIAGGIATYRRGLAAAQREALAALTAPREPWVPVWGAAEILMSFAYLYAHGPTPNRELARAYADGALAIVPDWHYVRDILIPQIDAGSSAAEPGK